MNIVLALIGVCWPVFWALWNRFSERKVKMSVIDSTIKKSKTTETNVPTALLTLRLFNYDNKPVCLIEGWARGHHNAGVPIFMNSNEPKLLMPNESLEVTYEIEETNKEIKYIEFYLADDRKFIIKGRVITFINKTLLENFSIKDGNNN